MLRNVFMVIMTSYVLGPIWSLITLAIIVAGGVGLLHFVWYVLITATAP